MKLALQVDMTEQMESNSKQADPRQPPECGRDHSIVFSPNDITEGSSQRVSPNQQRKTTDEHIREKCANTTLPNGKLIGHKCGDARLRRGRELCAEQHRGGSESTTQQETTATATTAEADAPPALALGSPCFPAQPELERGGPCQ